MASARSYGDPCGIARALDAAGERWAFLVVRELLLGPKRFTDLRTSLATASPNVLSQRLRELVEVGVVEKRSGRGGQAYALTPWGEELHPILLALGRWGARAPQIAGKKLGLDAFLLALEATYVAPRGTTEAAEIGLLVNDEPHLARFDGERLTITRGPPRGAPARITGSSAALRAVVFGDVPLAESDLQIEGERAIAKRFLRSFARPAAAPRLRPRALLVPGPGCLHRGP